jgi:hypothetical protein
MTHSKPNSRKSLIINAFGSESGQDTNRSILTSLTAMLESISYLLVSLLSSHCLLYYACDSFGCTMTSWTIGVVHISKRSARSIGCDGSPVDIHLTTSRRCQSSWGKSTFLVALIRPRFHTFQMGLLCSQRLTTLLNVKPTDSLVHFAGYQNQSAIIHM